MQFSSSGGQQPLDQHSLSRLIEYPFFQPPTSVILHRLYHHGCTYSDCIINSPSFWGLCGLSDDIYFGVWITANRGYFHFHLFSFASSGVFPEIRSIMQITSKRVNVHWLMRTGVFTLCIRYQRIIMFHFLLSINRINAIQKDVGANLNVRSINSFWAQIFAFWSSCFIRYQFSERPFFCLALHQESVIHANQCCMLGKWKIRDGIKSKCTWRQVFIRNNYSSNVQEFIVLVNARMSLGHSLSLPLFPLIDICSIWFIEFILGLKMD